MERFIAGLVNDFGMASPDAAGGAPFHGGRQIIGWKRMDKWEAVHPKAPPAAPRAG